jgi:energy-coupling factor transport system substrate-specific component
MVIGLVAGLAARKGLFRSLAGAVIAGVVITLFVTLVATPIRTFLFGGVTGSGEDFFVAYLTAVGQKLLQSVALTVIWTNLVDKIVACLVAQAVVRQLPGRIRSLFPGAENVA